MKFFKHLRASMGLGRSGAAILGARTGSLYSTPTLRASISCPAEAVQRRSRIGGGWRRRFLLTLTLLAGLVSGCQSIERIAAAPTPLWRVKLTVKEDARVDRVAEPVTSGIPIPLSLGIKSANGLRIVRDNKTEVPAQFTVLARWNGTVDDQTKAIQWVLVDFQADVAAGRSAAYYLAYQPDLKTTTPPISVKAVESGGTITVNTGPMQFRISKTSFNLFDGVWLDRNKDGRFDDSEAIISPGSADDGAFLIDTFDAWYGAHLGVKRVVIEENGPLRLVIKVEGRHQRVDQKGLVLGFYDYLTRIHAYAGKSHVKVHHTLKNSPPCSQKLTGYGSCPSPFFGSLAFKDYSIYTTLNLEKPIRQRIFADKRYETTGEPFSLYQDSSGGAHWQQHHGEYWGYDIQTAHDQNAHKELEGGPSFRGFRLNRGEKEVGKGERAQGWTDVYDTRWGVTAQIRHFWQQCPKGIDLEENKLILRLWPSAYQGIHWLDEGVHKTHELLYAFHLNDFNAEETIKKFNSPLLAVAPTSWYNDARVIGPFGDLQTLSAGDASPELPPARSRAGLGNKKTVYAAREPYNAWGWIPFGDIKANPGAAGCPCIDPSSFSFFLQTMERDYFDTAEELARQWMDARSYHRDLTAMADYRGEVPDVTAYQKGTHYQGWMPTDHYHAWYSVLYEYYLLTGNRKALEAAEELTRHERHIGFWWHFIEDKQTFPVERAYGWLAYELTRMYEITGKQIYLDDAERLLKKAYDQIDKRRGNLLDAYLYQPANTGGTTYTGSRLQYDYGATSWELGIALLGIGKYADVVLTQNIQRHFLDGEDARDFLVAGADLLVHEIFRSDIPIFPEDWFLTNPQPSDKELFPYGRHNAIEFQITAGLSIAYRLTGKKAYQDAVNAMLTKWGDKLDPFFQTAFANQHRRDVTPPSAIIDLQAEKGSKAGEVILRWTAPGGDGKAGKAARYQIKYAEKPIVERIDCRSQMSTCYRPCKVEGFNSLCAKEGAQVNFWAAVNVKGEPPPQPSGKAEQFTLKGLKPGKIYYFSIKSEDEARNMSDLSNVAKLSL
ncbi:MAG: hypothetical protein HY232_04935 [Acidobacteria bacterium]|nr:hypothetical protein [Acidobacteriota bacterium]